MGNSVGYWDACSGCTNGEDGYIDPQNHPPHPKHGCPMGIGCDECKGKGVVFHPLTKAMLKAIEEDGKAMSVNRER